MWGITATGFFNPATDPEGGYTYVITGNGTCAADSATVTVALSSSAFAGADTSLQICSTEDPVDLATLLPGANTGGTWSNGNGQYDPANDASATIRYIVNGIGQCSGDTAYINVVENQAPNAGIGGPLNICSNAAPVVLNSALGGSPDAGGTWHRNGSSVSNTYDPTVDAAGTYYYVVDGSGNCGADSAAISITLMAMSSAGADSSINVCSDGAVVDLNLLLRNADAGTWSNGSGMYDPTVASSGVVAYIVGAALPCLADTALFTINEMQAPNAGTGSLLSVCSNAVSVDLSSALGGAQDLGGNWTASDGTISTGTYDPATQSDDAFTYTVNGIAPCVAVSATVTVTETNAPSAAWTAPAPLCSSADPVDLTATVTGNSGGTWTGAGITSGHLFNPGTLVISDASTDSPVLYTVSEFGCTASQAGTITVWAMPTANAGIDSVVCALEYTLQPVVSIGQGTWSTSGSASISNTNAPNALANVNAPGAQNFMWTVNNGLCSASNAVQITFHDPSELTYLNAGPDQQNDAATDLILDGIANGATQSWWSLIAGNGNVQDPAALNTVVSGLGTGENVFILAAEVGNCPMRTDTIVITINGLFIPNGFSPNGDGVNDRYVIRGAEASATIYLDVFDRWGIQVFHSARYENEWNGTGTNGKPLMDGTYFAVVKIDGKDIWNGSITLKR